MGQSTPGQNEHRRTPSTAKYDVRDKRQLCSCPCVRALRSIPGIQGPDIQGPGIQGPGIQGPGIQGPGIQGPGIQGPGIQGPGIQGPGAGFALPLIIFWSIRAGFSALSSQPPRDSFQHRETVDSCVETVLFRRCSR